MIKNTLNGRVYVGSSRNIENRLQTHFEDLRSQKHHSWKLQEDWRKFGKTKFVKEIIHSLEVSDPQLELQLEIFERAEVLTRDAVSLGYNVSDEIIRDTSLVLKFCDGALNTYLEVNREKFAGAVRESGEREGFLKKFALWAIPNLHQHKADNLLDVNRHASDYLRSSLLNLFIESGLNEANSSLLADSYVIDVHKMRGNNFRFWGRSV